MGTVVYRGLHESQLVEPRALRLRLTSPRPHYSSFLELPLKPPTLDDGKYQVEKIIEKTKTIHESSNTSPDSGGWSFLQALDNKPCENNDESKKQTAYVHPLLKRQSSTLSDKSLELCTESLGSETGSDIIEDSIFSLLSEIDSTITQPNEENSPTWEQKIMKPRQVFGGNNTKASSRSFPPPLTTMTGSKSIQVRPHREDGRLVIEAIKSPSTQTYFHAERSHGRLTLTLIKDFSHSFGDNEEEENENNVANFDDDEEYEESEDEIDEEERNGNNKDEFQRPSRCKQGELEKHKGIIRNWEHLCVATS